MQKLRGSPISPAESINQHGQPYPERRREFLGSLLGPSASYGKSGAFLTASDQFLTNPAYFGHAESGWPAIRDFLG